VTTRDEVWAAALETVSAKGRFKRAELGFDDEHRHTVRRTLGQMEQRGWLWRTGKYSPFWRAGPKARARMTLSEEALEAADRGVDADDANDADGDPGSSTDA
jgi:hypothetical protein